MTTTSPQTASPHEEPHEAALRAGWSVRRHLALFTVALLVPILAVLGFVLYRVAATERARLEREAGEIAQSIAVAIDRDLTGLFAALDVLTTSANLMQENLEGFHGQMTRLLENQGVATVLYDLEGQQLANVRIPWGRPLPRSDLAFDHATLARGRPFVTDLLVGQISETRQFLVVRGIRAQRRLKYVLAFSVPLSRLDNLLRDLGIPKGYTASIVDRRHVIMARTRAPEEFVGHKTLPGLAEALAAERGTWQGATREGVPIFVAFQRSRLSGYGGLVGIDNADLEAPVLRSLAVLGLTVAASAALSIWLALFVGRRITRPIAALARTAAALGRGEKIEPLTSRLAEANQVGRVLVSASTHLREREDDLREANGELQRFAYIVSHDLRSPLVNIMGFTAELEALRGDLFARLAELRRAVGEAGSAGDDALAADFDEAIGFIKTSISKMDRLINAILSLSRAGRREFHPERIDMDALIRTILASLATQAETAGASVAAKPLPSIVSDRLALEQIFSNLVDNALKYLREDVPGRIEIIGRARGASLVYEIRDNGRGIEEKDLERVFDLFRRSGVQDRPGEGIGLAHVRALVRRLGGTITLASEPGRGSVFTVTLPRRWAEQDGRKAT
ncbi:sensor histidine kinase [Enterovirga sp.]|uniref:sensor histidine kinase n=1 Tax=Enterovirga sp. TaxID=2026350 RepID=UPI002C9997F8|nr:sensor histidine kinase [Enterovirga sp.]HMO30002.1 sensor histidine kinase [Enterovirga sp.]